MSQAGRHRAPAAPAEPASPWPLAPLGRQLELALDAERTLAEGYDAKALHAWRVQLRRLIAAADGLARLPPAAPPDLVDRLKALRQRTGGSRDIDVLLDTTLPGFLARKPERQMEPALRARLENRRATARRQALTVIADDGLGPQATQLTARLEEQVTAIGLPPTALAAALLDERLRKLHRRQRKFRRSPQRLHRLRTAVKNMNYALALGENLFGHIAAEAWSGLLAELQDLLGKAHDHLAAGELLTGLDLPPGEARFAKAFQRWCRRRAAKTADQAATVIKRLDELERFWR